MKIIRVKLEQNPYNIYIDNNIFKNIPKYIAKLNLGNFGIIITSNKIKSLYKRQIHQTFTKNKNYKLITVVNGETAKSKKWFFNVIEEITKISPLGKKIFVICLGGGVVGDLGGFVASVYKRGIPYIQIPTTLLSQIDSSIGGKTAIDLPQAKNILGTIYQPKAVFIDPIFLKTLPLKELKQGIAETIKYGIIKDKKFFQFLLNNSQNILKFESAAILRIIYTCTKIKADIVSCDETEKLGIRTILNFGHTFAHALESTTKYRNISHGDAVAIGMVYAAILSLILKACPLSTVNEITAILRLFKLPLGGNFEPAALYKSLSYDKKFTSGKIRMVIVKRVGEVKILENIPPKLILSAFKKMSEFS